MDSKKQSRKGFHFGSGTLRAVSVIAAPILSVLFYVCIVLAAVLAIIALIVVLVNPNTAPENMMLPPFMHTVSENGVLAGYNISVGNGISMYAEYSTVELRDIKLVIYAGIVIAAAVLLTLAPLFRFLSKLLGNIAKKRPLDIANARYVSYIGLTALVGQTVILFVSRFYNYTLVKTFVAGGENMSLLLGLDIGGLAYGALILLIGAVYGYACETAAAGAQSAAVVLDDRE